MRPFTDNPRERTRALVIVSLIDQLHMLESEVLDLRAEIAELRAHLNPAASRPAPLPSGAKDPLDPLPASDQGDGKGEGHLREAAD